MPPLITMAAVAAYLAAYATAHRILYACRYLPSKKKRMHMISLISILLSVALVNAQCSGDKDCGNGEVCFESKCIVDSDCHTVGWYWRELTVGGVTGFSDQWYAIHKTGFLQEKASGPTDWCCQYFHGMTCSGDKVIKM